jgi:large subunit ribosomal protein L21
MYAVLETGGKQYRVAPGDVIRVEKVGAPGEEIEFSQVLMLVRDDGTALIGSPTVDGAKVKGSVVSHGKAKKIHVFKYKPKVNYRRRYGHRQPYAEVRIEAIEG